MGGSSSPSLLCSLQPDREGIPHVKKHQQKKQTSAQTSRHRNERGGKKRKRAEEARCTCAHARCTYSQSSPLTTTGEGEKRGQMLSAHLWVFFLCCVLTLGPFPFVPCLRCFHPCSFLPRRTPFPPPLPPSFSPPCFTHFRSTSPSPLSPPPKKIFPYFTLSKKVPPLPHTPTHPSPPNKQTNKQPACAPLSYSPPPPSLSLPHPHHVSNLPPSCVKLTRKK